MFSVVLICISMHVLCIWFNDDHPHAEQAGRYGGIPAVGSGLTGCCRVLMPRNRARARFFRLVAVDTGSPTAGLPLAYFRI